MTIGPPLLLDGPVPVAPPHSLLNTAQIVEESDGHWLAGGHVYSYPTDLATAHDPCDEGTFRLKPEGNTPEQPIFGSYELALPITCSTYEGKNPGFADRARLAFQAVESFAVANELASGATMVLNPSIADVNVVLLNAGAATAPADALAYLEDAIGATARMGMIHATPSTASAWTDGQRIDEVGGRLITLANRTPIAADGGYIGVTPSGGGAAAAGQSWAFATGPVQYRRTEIDVVPDDLSEALDRTLNVVTYRAERGYLVVWDTALQVAVLVDWTP